MPPVPAMKSTVPGRADAAGCRAGRIAVPCVTAPSARRRARTAPAAARLRKPAEPPGPDRRPAHRQRPSDAVHAAHDAVTGPEDHRVRQVRLSHAPEEPGDLPDRGALQLTEPVPRADLRHVTKCGLFGRQAGRPALPGGQRPKRPSRPRPARSGTASAPLRAGTERWLKRYASCAATAAAVPAVAPGAWLLLLTWRNRCPIRVMRALPPFCSTAWLPRWSARRHAEPSILRPA